MTQSGPETSPDPIVFLPGFMCDARLFWHQILDFSATHAVMVMPLRGQTVEEMAQHVLAQAPAKFALVGHWLGGLVAMEIMRRAPERLSQVIAEMADLDCECRKKVEFGIRGGLEGEVANASVIREKLAVLIRTKYMETARQVVREFRIFTGTNALVFALLVAAVPLKPRAGLHLLPSAALLLTAALVTGYLYLFNQDWLHTLVFNDFVGWGYLAYLGGAFALLGDVVLNKARVTTEVLRLVLDAAGSAVEVVPC